MTLRVFIIIIILAIIKNIQMWQNISVAIIILILHIAHIVSDNNSISITSPHHSCDSGHSYYLTGPHHCTS